MARLRPSGNHSSPVAAYQSSIRVYYEDTDAGGIVYHANYLRFFERVRTDWLRSLGVHQRELASREQLLFVVRDMAIDFRSPARLDDLLLVDVRVAQARRASLRLSQSARRDGEPNPLVTAEVTVAAINAQGRPVTLPDWLLERLTLQPCPESGQA